MCAPLSAAERDALWADYRVVGRRFGLREREMPPDAAAFDDYMAAMVEGDELHVSPRARELAVEIVLRPPVGLRRRPLVELVNQITVGLLPAPVRRLYGFSWDPVRSAAVYGGAEYVRRVLLPLLGGRLSLLPAARAA